MRIASTIELDSELRTKLLKIVHSPTASAGLARRCAIVLLADDGYDNLTIADMLGIGRIQVARWRERFCVGGLADIEKDLPSDGRPVDRPIEAQIVQLTTQSAPEATTQWSTRTLAKVVGDWLSASWLNRIERFFRDISLNRLGRGMFTSVPKLAQAIGEYVAHANTNSKPFIWTKNACDILQKEKVIRVNSRLSIKQNEALPPPHPDNEGITDPPALLFRVTDRLRLDGFVAAMVQDGMSLALISRHEGTLDHYGKLLVQRLRAAAPEIALEVYFPASVEALLARFNDALRDYSVEDAMQGAVQNSAPRIWILHDAGTLPDHEIELLARLIAHFPGANIRVLLLLTANSNKHHLLNPFGRRILRWEIEPPTPEQAQAMLTQARSQGREGEALSLLQSAPAVQAVKAAAQTTQTSPQTGTSGKKHWRIAAVIAALLVASTGAAFLLHTRTGTTDADVATVLKKKSAAAIAPAATPKRTEDTR